MIAILGFVVSLCGSGAVYASFTNCIISSSFIAICSSLGIAPVPVAILSLAVGLVILFSGIYLLPRQKDEILL
ncbi:putative membrane protein [Chlamydia ibidis]|uniref:Membrane protein n=3 Tax=Chlamydia ibidis TaxID=1405396 RepID=A0ABP2XEZ6_9CHLA|nr:putative membrane protein [Chlamydia ibidis]EQM63058.1 putative membrane protein [Chlamydia ibidis 10-1398/6]